MNKLITLLILVSIAAFGQTKEPTIKLPADIQKKLMSLDSVIQIVNKQYREIVEPLQKQQQLIFEMAFSFQGVDISKVDSVRYDKGVITFKPKKK